MEKAEVRAMVGKKAVLEMHGKHLDGKWEVVVQGVVENNPRFKNHAKVLWQKPATQFNAADTEPVTHYVPLGSLKPTEAQLKAREDAKLEKAQKAEERKVAQKPKATRKTVAGKMSPTQLIKLADAIKTLKEAGFDVDWQ